MTNRLADSISPYLQQHAGNPVDWYPWSPEALEAARTSDRPILLSIGYSACHWCHVMAHESFEDAGIAERMNAWFVNIKVDREERPDLDRIYQLAHQLLTGRGGGWPLTVFLDPTDLVPFVAGTYFPPEARHGLIGFAELLERVHSAWLNQRDTLRAQNRQLQQALTMVSQRSTRAEAGADDPADRLVDELAARFDSSHGGFGTAPKFPQAPLLDWLAGRARDDETAAGMLFDTLRPMARHGLFDHLAGGFFRYCVDQAWEIPHFEKMLYDNALLLPIYAETAARWNDATLRRTAEATAAFMLEDLALDAGGLASSLDADSVPGDLEPGEPPEPREGAHYLWTPGQFEACLAAETEPGVTELARARFGLDGPANFPPGAAPDRDDEHAPRQWHLVIARSIDELTDRDHDADAVLELLERARQRLLACRRRRPAPGRDDKMLGSWNALAAIGLFRAARALDRADWIGAGVELVDRIWQRLFDTAPPRAVWRDGRSAHPALLDDHAALLLAGMERLSCRWDAGELQRLEWLAGQIRDRFHDPESGTLYLTPNDHERLIMRPTAAIDDATPAGAALAVRGLLRLGHLTGNPDWIGLAENALDAVAGDLQRVPMAHASMLAARAELDHPPPQVLIGGPGKAPDDWHARLSGTTGVLSYRVTGEPGALPGPLATLAGAERTMAVICLGQRCLAPVHDFDELMTRLDEYTA